jgi:hypothetical protein
MDRLDKLEIEIAKLDGFTKGLADSLRFLVEKLERVDNGVHEKLCQTEGSELIQWLQYRKDQCKMEIARAKETNSCDSFFTGLSQGRLDIINDLLMHWVKE